MTRLISNSDLRRLFVGAAPVVAVGLACGAFMHPTLRVGEEATGPQMLSGAPSVRSERVAQQAVSWASYRDKVPDYVIGADWAHPAVQEAVPADPAAPPEPPPAQREARDGWEPTPARWQDSEPAPPRYPSMAGGSAYESDLPAPPDPPGDEEPAAG